LEFIVAVIIIQTAKGKNKNLNTIINKKLKALNLSNYNAKMIRNRAEATAKRHFSTVGPVVFCK
jgi:hypothetical protein